ncbi:hypothetical protein C8J34_1011352 [Rhizobium sp. PP-F2F-G36]|nr:hypothetical protein C8J34_1011352 [Rhizobium sp. PP-F2F-G36]
MARSTGDSSFGSKDFHIGHAVLLILRGETEPNDPYFLRERSQALSDGSLPEPECPEPMIAE